MSVILHEVKSYKDLSKQSWGTQVLLTWQLGTYTAESIADAFEVTVVLLAEPVTEAPGKRVFDAVLPRRRFGDYIFTKLYINEITKSDASEYCVHVHRSLGSSRLPPPLPQLLVLLENL